MQSYLFEKQNRIGIVRMVFEMSWIKHRLRNSQVGNVIHILQKPRLVQSKGQRQQIGSDYKFLFCCSIVIFSFSKHFI